MSKESNDYLQKHNIPALFELLCAQLVYTQPEDPFQYLSDELKKLSATNPGKPISSQSLVMFNQADFEAMFGMLDPVQSGYVTGKQAHKAISDLGLNPDKAGLTPDPNIKLNLSQFVARCKAAI
jgi:hypothetical protein